MSPGTDSFDDLADAVVALDAERRVRGLNRAAAELAGRPAAELVGMSCTEAFAPRDLRGRPVLADGWHRSASLPSVTALREQEAVVKTAAGDRRVKVTGRYRRDAAGALTGAVLCIRPRPRGPDEPTGAEVISTVSHELRSPLTSVKGYTSLLLNRWDRVSDEQKKHMLTQVHHDADRVTRLITELLDISRLETGRLTVRAQRVKLPELARSVVDKLTVTQPELECALDFGDDFPAVLADPDKVEQVLTNLVENAAKYASPKGMRMVGEALPAGDGQAALVGIAVHDRGEGIPAEDLRRVFTKFFRREVGRPTGTGLGLWISRGLVEAQGGRLTVASTLGEGSTFRFTLPVFVPDQNRFDVTPS